MGQKGGYRDKNLFGFVTMDRRRSLLRGIENRCSFIETEVKGIAAKSQKKKSLGGEKKNV